MKRTLLCAFALATSISFAHAQGACPVEEEFCPDDEVGAFFDEGTINVFTPFSPFSTGNPTVRILPPSPIIPNDPVLPPNPIQIRPGVQK